MTLTVKELKAMLECENENNKVVIASTDGLDLIEISKVANMNENGITVIVTR